MARLSAGRGSASSYDARHLAKNRTGVNCEYELSNNIRSGWCFVGAATFTAASISKGLEPEHPLHTVVESPQDQEVYVADTQNDHCVSTDLECLFNG
jgi:hypothetical protein